MGLGKKVTIFDWEWGRPLEMDRKGPVHEGLLSVTSKTMCTEYWLTA